MEHSQLLLTAVDNRGCSVNLSDGVHRSTAGGWPGVHTAVMSMGGKCEHQCTVVPMCVQFRGLNAYDC